MKIALLSPIIIAALLIGGCSSGESYVKAGYNFVALEKVAIVDIQGDFKSDAAKSQIADFFHMELLKKGYTPVERAHVQALLKEQQFQTSDLVTQEGAAKAGRILNVPVVMIISIPNFGEQISMTAKLVEVETGAIVWMGSGTGTTGKTLATIFGAAAGAGAGAAVSGRDDRVTGGVIGGVLGGVAGNALSPQKEKKVREMTAQICKSLPSRLPHTDKKGKR